MQDLSEEGRWLCPAFVWWVQSGVSHALFTTGTVPDTKRGLALSSMWCKLCTEDIYVREGVPKTMNLDWTPFTTIYKQFQQLMLRSLCGMDFQLAWQGHKLLLNSLTKLLIWKYFKYFNSSLCTFLKFFISFQPNHTRRRARDLPKNYNVSDSNDEASVSKQIFYYIGNHKHLKYLWGNFDVMTINYCNRNPRRWRGKNVGFHIWLACML